MFQKRKTAITLSIVLLWSIVLSWCFKNDNTSTIDKNTSWQIVSQTSSIANLPNWDGSFGTTGIDIVLTR